MNFKITNINYNENKITIENRFYKHVIDFKEETIINIMNTYSGAKWYTDSIERHLFDLYNISVSKLLGEL